LAGIGLGKQVENPRQHFRSDSNAVVPNPHQDLPTRRVAFDYQSNVSTRRRELRGVVQKIRERLDEPDDVDVYSKSFFGQQHIEFVSAVLDQGAAAFDSPRYHGLNGNNFPAKLHLAMCDAPGVEKIVDEPDQGIELPTHHLADLM
jgi:hypothetical protein